MLDFACVNPQSLLFFVISVSLCEARYSTVLSKCYTFWNRKMLIQVSDTQKAWQNLIPGELASLDQFIYDMLVEAVIMK